MIHAHNEEGYAGPGFFINTEKLRKASDAMKSKLGIPTQKTSNLYLASYENSQNSQSTKA